MRTLSKQPLFGLMAFLLGCQDLSQENAAASLTSADSCFATRWDLDTRDWNVVSYDYNNCVPISATACEYTKSITEKIGVVAWRADAATATEIAEDVAALGYTVSVKDRQRGVFLDGEGDLGEFETDIEVGWAETAASNDGSLVGSNLQSTIIRAKDEATLAALLANGCEEEAAE